MTRPPIPPSLLRHLRQVEASRGRAPHDLAQQRRQSIVDHVGAVVDRAATSDEPAEADVLFRDDVQQPGHRPPPIPDALRQQIAAQHAQPGADDPAAHPGLRAAGIEVDVAPRNETPTDRGIRLVRELLGGMPAVDANGFPVRPEPEPEPEPEVDPHTAAVADELAALRREIETLKAAGA